MKFIYKAITVTLMLALFANVKAQEFDVFAEFNGGLPISNSLKNYHDELAEQVVFQNFETTDNFGYNYGFTLGFRFNRKASIFFSNRVSGAKSSVADFSGFVRLTNELTGYTIGMEYEFLLNEFANGNLNLGVKALITPSSLTLGTESSILNQTQNESLEFRSLDFGGGLGLNYEYAFSFITLRAHVDLNVYLGGKLSLKGDDSGGYLTDLRGNKVTTSWTGLVGGIGVLIPLSK